MHTDRIGCQLLDCCPNVHGVTAEPVKLGYDEHVAWLKSVKQASKLRALSGCNATADTFANDPAFVYGETS